jgi:hypothetical protein
MLMTALHSDPSLLNLDIGSWGELSAAAVASVALLFSYRAFRHSGHTTKQLTFITFQEHLQSPEAAEGRRLIYDIESEKDVVKMRKRTSDWDKLNRAITLWNTLGQYVRHDLVEKDLAVAIWGDAIEAAWPHLVWVIQYRRRERADKWTSLVWLAEHAGVSIPANLK